MAYHQNRIIFILSYMKAMSIYFTYKL